MIKNTSDVCILTVKIKSEGKGKGEGEGKGKGKMFPIGKGTLAHFVCVAFVV